MGKKSTSSSTTEEKEMTRWTGKNYSFSKFDRTVLNWACTKWNDELGAALWKDSFADELFQIPETAQEWLDHCELIHRFNLTDDYKNSKVLHGDAAFWTHSYQKIWLDRQRGLLYRRVEKCVEGGAETILNTIGAKDARKLRRALMKKYGNARAVKLETRQKLFDLGMPPTDDKNAPVGSAFEERTDMGEKFQELEDEKDELFNACPVKHQATYKYGMESHLTRIVKNNIHSSYHEVVRSVETMHRIRKNGGLSVVKDLDLHEHSYTDDHLPPWGELKDAVIEQYEIRKLNWDSYPEKDGRVKVPVMAMTGDPKCFACGETGHRRGANVCKAGPRDVHDSAPDWVKNQKGGRNGGTGNGGNGNRNSGKQICNFFKANGTCRFGDRCKFEHVGGGSSSGGGGNFGMNKGDRKRITAMVAQSLCDQMQQGGSKKSKKEGGDGKDAVQRLFSLMTSAGSLKE